MYVLYQPNLVCDILCIKEQQRKRVIILPKCILLISLVHLKWDSRKGKKVRSQYFQYIPILVDILQNKKSVCISSNQGPKRKADSLAGEEWKQRAVGWPGPAENLPEPCYHVNPATSQSVPFPRGGNHINQGPQCHQWSVLTLKYQREVSEELWSNRLYTKVKIYIFTAFCQSLF